jgi:hypothetical protein
VYLESDERKECCVELMFGYNMIVKYAIMLGSDSFVWRLLSIKLSNAVKIEKKQAVLCIF